LDDPEGYDAFLTGEPKENVMAERFGIEHVWVDLPNPV
jgi:hypothetical protein